MKNNIQINGDNCIIEINPKIYALDVIYSAAYVFIDKAYIILDGDPKKKITVLLKPKEDYDLEKLGMEFNNELLNYAQYKEKNTQNKPIREAIIQRALITNDPSLIDDGVFDDDELDDFLDDPEGIAIPWEEKYGKDSKKNDS
jgi:His-Xaa-Ser system protein HxsD